MIGSIQIPAAARTAGPVTWISYAIALVVILLLARRDLRVSTATMLTTETISVLIVLGLCLVLLRHGGPQADLAAVDPIGDQALQVRSGLMVAVLSFIGFESAATLGSQVGRWAG
ncbi:hypothetical protein NZK32_15460 [Cyanobium sp. FGCU-52]|nr:hypothetical protein [Cyanobium sp. FGCU52]